MVTSGSTLYAVYGALTAQGNFVNQGKKKKKKKQKSLVLDNDSL